MGLADSMYSSAKTLMLATVLAAPWNAFVFGVLGGMQGGMGVLAGVGVGFVGGPVILLCMETIGVPVMRQFLKLEWGGVLMLPFALVRILCDFVPLWLARAMVERRPSSSPEWSPPRAAEPSWEGRITPGDAGSSELWAAVESSALVVDRDDVVSDGDQVWGRVDDEGHLFRAGGPVNALARIEGRSVRAGSREVGRFTPS